MFLRGFLTAVVNVKDTITEVCASSPCGIYLGKGRLQWDILFAPIKFGHENYRFSHDATKI